MNKSALLKKYDINCPRYTSYPAIPFWNDKLSSGNLIELIKNDAKEGVDLYVHIPFCKTLCWYCGCHRTVTKNQVVEKSYVDALIKEFKLYQERLGAIIVNSIHLGGGTPNFITSEGLEKLLSVILKHRNSESFIGAVEVDPRTLSLEQLNVFKKFGFSRVSCGIQDFDDKVQRSINRIQPFHQVKAMALTIRDLGFKSLNFDLIYGLPNQTLETVEKTTKQVIELQPDMIALYSYAHLPAKMANQKLIKDEELLKGEEKRALADLADKLLLENGYVKIGLDHYAKEDSYLATVTRNKKLKRNFMGYTDKKSKVQIGLGVSSISESPAGFVQNLKEIKDYILSLEANELPIFKGHLMSERDLSTYTLIQNLMCNGVVEKPLFHKLADSTRENNFQEFLKDHLVLDKIDKYEVTEYGMNFTRNMAMIFDDYLNSKQVQFSRSL